MLKLRKSVKQQKFNDKFYLNLFHFRIIPKKKLIGIHHIISQNKKSNYHKFSSWKRKKKYLITSTSVVVKVSRIYIKSTAFFAYNND